MSRLHILQCHLESKANWCKRSVTGKLCSSWDRTQTETSSLLQELNRVGEHNIEVRGPPVNHEKYFRVLMTPPAVHFIARLVRQFDNDVVKMLQERTLRKLELDQSGALPDFPRDNEDILHGNWKVEPVPRRLQNRHVDLGDVSPSNTSHFVAALKSSAQGIQTDFDDGHCPTWPNQLRGLYNVHQAVHNNIKGVPTIDKAPVLMLRPRAWNMIEHNLLVDGKEVPGPLFDFGLLMFHNAKILLDNNSGPFFYLSKLEGYKEARLWDRIFTWTENQLHLPHGCVKACVLIENVLATFQLEEILYELRDHSAGLNCGIWDYSASFINKFGHRKEFQLPDRNKYVSMEKHFLKSYMDLVIRTCHNRGCHATGGMAAPILPPSDTHPQYEALLQKVISGKQREIDAGADGFMVYDLRLVEHMHKLWNKLAPGDNQWSVKRREVSVTAADLLLMPSGSVTWAGLKHNITVGILFIEAWLRGQGHFYLKGAVEDSATAEISRSQVWQWIRHGATVEDRGDQVVTMATVHSLVKEVLDERFWSLENSSQFVNVDDRQRLQTAADMFEEIVTKKEFPEFITTYLNLDHTFLMYQEKFFQ